MTVETPQNITVICVKFDWIWTLQAEFKLAAWIIPSSHYHGQWFCNSQTVENQNGEGRFNEFGLAIAMMSYSPSDQEAF